MTKKRSTFYKLLGSFGKGHRIISMSPMNFRLRKPHREQGYVLLVLLLMVSLLSIGFLAMIKGIEFQTRRDREEEFIHRGVEYSRAVRRYVKKFGRYPPSIEALENTDNLRFLRKRYKDPLTGKNFKVLYYGDVKEFNPLGPGGANASIPTSNPIPTGQINNGLPEGPPSSEAQSAPINDSSRTSQLDQSASKRGETATPQPLGDPAAHTADKLPGDAESDATEKLAATRVIVGVTSYSNRETIRVFNKKNHYNQWQFVYDPSTDRALMKGPNQPLPIGAGQAPPVQNEEGPTSNAGMNPGQK